MPIVNMLESFFKKNILFFGDDSKSKITTLMVEQGKEFVVQQSESFLSLLNDLSHFYFVIDGEAFVNTGENVTHYKKGDFLLNFLPLQQQAITISAPLQLLRISKEDFYSLLSKETSVANEFQIFIGQQMSNDAYLKDLYDFKEMMSLLKVKLSAEIQSSTVLGKMEYSRLSLEKTGAQIIERMLALLSNIKKIDISGENHYQIIQSDLMNMITNETQNFDIIAQQLHAIEQDLKNILAYVEEKSPIDIQGDKNIFSVKLVREKQDDYGDMEVF